MGNKVISYSLKGFEVFLKVPVIIIIGSVENNVLGGWVLELRGSPDIFHDLYQNQILHHFGLNFFPLDE